MDEKRILLGTVHIELAALPEFVAWISQYDEARIDHLLVADRREKAEPVVENAQTGEGRG